jgi:sister-chromatid-cohesion protein PDS5
MLLAFISKHCPALYKPHIGQLLKAVGNETDPTFVEVCLQALSALIKWDPKLAAWDKLVNPETSWRN